MLYLIFLLSLHCLILSTRVEGCQSSIGGTCVGGISYYGDLSTVNRIETCADDINKDWCVIVYKENIGQAEFHCLNLYNINPFVTPTCGNGLIGQINSGGCGRLRAPDGSACLVCCCRGSQCNNQFVFTKELNQAYYFTGNSPSNYSILSSFILTLIFYFGHFLTHIQ